MIENIMQNRSNDFWNISKHPLLLLAQKLVTAQWQDSYFTKQLIPECKTLLSRFHKEQFKMIKILQLCLLLMPINLSSENLDGCDFFLEDWEKAPASGYKYYRYQ